MSSQINNRIDTNISSQNEQFVLIYTEIHNTLSILFDILQLLDDESDLELVNDLQNSDSVLSNASTVVM